MTGRWDCVRVFTLLVLLSPVAAVRAEEEPDLQRAFEERTGARLVFDRADLPPGRYHDDLPVLDAANRMRAARIALAEMSKLPPGYLRAIGLTHLGIFRACVSRQGDGFRPFDRELNGYRYYGIWNGNSAAACAYYSDSQLGLTLHHEVFHHVDATHNGRTDGARLTADEDFAALRSGQRVYPPLALNADDLAALKARSSGATLEGAVSAYAAKSMAEDKAETARYVMSHLPDALVQAATRPDLPGSQRILHILARYKAASATGPNTAWFVGVALNRGAAPPAPRPDQPDELATARQLLQRLRAALDKPLAPRTVEEARAALYAAARLAPEDVTPEEAEALAAAAAALSARLATANLAPSGQFVVRGQEDAQGVNRTLRRDVELLAEDADAVRRIAALSPRGAAQAAADTRRSLRLLARYYLYLSGRWQVTPGTRQVFDDALGRLTAVLPADQARELRQATDLQPARLAALLTDEGRAITPEPERDNPYLARVDAAIADPTLRQAIRRVQPACVRIGNGSGVNLAPEGLILTNAHVAQQVGARLKGVFPDGRAFTATCTHLDAHLDLALCAIGSRDPLPVAPLAAQAPAVGTPVVCIGQPGGHTPEGERTGYQPFHVSLGSIRGYMDDPLGSQALGRVMHDAWTYWGHSGSPLFDSTGHVVALHNSWNSRNSMRHAVPLQAIRAFLKRERVEGFEE